MKSSFTSAEVTALTNISKIMASQITIKYMIDFLEESNKRWELDQELYSEIMDELKSIPICEYVGSQLLDIPTTDYKIEMKLANVTRDYGIEIKLPFTPDKKYIQLLFNQLDNIVSIAMMYYKKTIGDTPILHKIQQLLTNVDCSRIKIDEKTRNISLDNTSNICIGINCRIIDSEGNTVIFQ